MCCWMLCCDRSALSAAMRPFQYSPSSWRMSSLATVAFPATGANCLVWRSLPLKYSPSWCKMALYSGFIVVCAEREIMDSVQKTYKNGDIYCIPCFLTIFGASFSSNYSLSRVRIENHNYWQLIDSLRIMWKMRFLRPTEAWTYSPFPQALFSVLERHRLTSSKLVSPC